MIKLIEKLNEISQNKYNFSLQSATLDSAANFCVINIFYDDKCLIGSEDIKNLKMSAMQILPTKFNYEINFVKNYFSKERIKEEITNFMHKNFSSMSFKLENIVFDSNKFETEIFIEQLAFSHAKEKDLLRKLERCLVTKFNGLSFEFKLNTFEKKLEQVDEQNIKITDESWRNKRVIHIVDPVPLIGETVEGDAKYIMDQNEEIEIFKICGKIKSIRSVELKRKPKDNKTNSDLDDNSNESEVEVVQTNEEKQDDYKKMLFLFTLQDFTGEMKCKIISTKETQKKLEKLNIGSMLACEGKIENDTFSGNNVLYVKKISYCSEPNEKEEYIEFLSEKENYEFVFPQQMTIYRQDDLMSFAQNKFIPQYLQNKTFVCYDLETTGLSFETGDKMIEIGAIKIENGKITEKFMSYINPEKPIPKESSKISGIVDSDVKDAPRDFEVLGDFYKFSRGAILIGYNNVGFDNKFLIGQGRKNRWNFDNPTEDVFKFAQKYVYGVSNYKLGTIAKHLGVSLDNAHRAVYDALATAEIFLKIAEKM